jgi:hypothetical protein
VIFELVSPGVWLLSGRKLYPRPDDPILPPEAWGLPERNFVIEIRFMDGGGRSWHRDQRGVLTRVAAKDVDSAGTAEPPRA